MSERSNHGATSRSRGLHESMMKFEAHSATEFSAYSRKSKTFNNTLDTFDLWLNEGKKEMFYLTTHSTQFIYGYMASDIWLRTSLIVRKET